MFVGRGALRLAKLLTAAVFALVLSGISAPVALATGSQQSECVIGSSSTCPAMTPQEIYNLYGTTTDGIYWIYDNGVAAQVYLKMNQTGTSNGSWVLMMKGTPASPNFTYSSSFFTSNTSNSNSTIANNFTDDAKYAVYNDLPITHILAVFANPQAGSLPSGGDIANNGFGGWTWKEDISSQSMYTRLSTTQDIATTTSPTTGGLRYSLWQNGASSLFANETGWAVYGFNHSTSCGSLIYRWGIIWNNETGGTGSNDSCDTHVGIGLSTISSGDIANWNGVVAAGGQTVSNGYNGGLGKFAFQLWGKTADPSVATPQSLVVNTATVGSLGLTWSAPAATTANEYVVQYKPTATGNWATANTFRITSPGASPSATISGLTGGISYDVRVWARTTSDSSASAIAGSGTTKSTTVTALALPGNATTATFRNAVVLTASIQAAGKVTFYEQGHPIPGCKGIPVSGSTATCNWRPSVHNASYVQAIFTPNSGSGLTGSSSTKLMINVASRGGNR